MHWITLEDTSLVESFIEKTVNSDLTVLFFKHSTRCPVSSMAKSRLERHWVFDDNVVPVYLDLIAYRPVSNYLEDRLSVKHESPQILIIQKGNLVAHTSHNAISIDFISDYLS